MTSVNELNAYNLGMKEGERVGMKAGEKASHTKLHKILVEERKRYLRLNQGGGVRIIQRLIAKFMVK